MVDPQDVEATRLAKREFTRHSIDTSLADIRVMHGTVYFRGTLKPDGVSLIPDLREEVERIARMIKGHSGVREIILDVLYQG
jgi:hypothetical protein